MPEPKVSRVKSGNPRPGDRKDIPSELIPANPLPARQALLQVALLLGIPLLLLILARLALRHFFPSLGY